MDSDRIEGKAKQVEGEAQETWGKVKDKARDCEGATSRTRSTGTTTARTRSTASLDDPGPGAGGRRPPFAASHDRVAKCNGRENRAHDGGAAAIDERGTGVESEAHALGALAAELSAAATPDEVAHALVERMPPLLGAVGGALGLVQDDELVIVDPGGVRRATLPARLRIPLGARAPIAGRR